MYRKTDRNRVYNARKDKTTQELIHLHMSNHYRRILNAKKAIDDSPPYCFKLKKLESRRSGLPEKKGSPTFENLPLTDRSLSTNSNWGRESGASSSRYHAKCVPKPLIYSATKRAYDKMNLVNTMTCDTVKRAVSYRKKDNTLEEKDEENNDKTKSELDAHQKSNQTKSSLNPKEDLPTPEFQESGQKRKFLDQNKNQKVSSEKATCAQETPNCKFTKICNCEANETVLKKISFNPKEQSLTSSRDSAYNGGVSSLPESRSPTPDHRKKKECCCCCYCEKKEGKRSSKTAESTGGSPKVWIASSLTTQTQTPEEESFKKMQEDGLYVKFVQDITSEILAKNLYTNKALKKIMKKHMKNNLKKLEKDRMLKEVEHLRMQLGIPEDKSLLEFELKEESNSYPMISDSEFVMPKNGDIGDGKSCSLGTKTCDKIGKSISAVISLTKQSEKVGSESETEDVISVIQVMKAVRERRIEKNVEREFNRQNSSDDSNSPSNSKKRSVLKNRKQKYLRTYSSSSSESERPGKFFRKFREKINCEDSTSKETSLEGYVNKPSLLSKKSRNVSFWKNPELNLRRTFEVKQKKGGSFLKNEKPKND